MKQLSANITFRPDITREQAIDILYSISDALDVPELLIVQEGPNLRGLVAPTPEEMVGHLIDDHS